VEVLDPLELNLVLGGKNLKYTGNKMKLIPLHKNKNPNAQNNE